MNILSGLSQWYFSIVFAYVLVYLANSVQSPLPWSQCGQEWNSIHCIPPGSSAQDYGRNANSSKMLLNASANWMNSSSTGNMSSSASREFWLRYVLQLSPGLEDMGGLVWYTSLALFISFVLTFVCIIKSIRSVGKVVYVTALLPYILLTVLMIKGLTLTGAVEGITFYVYPNFNKLLLTSTWIEASIQVFYSLGPAYGGLITMASYNKFNNNCLRDSVILCFVCEGTSVFAGFTIFSILGHMAYNLNTTVSSFAQSGPGLAFVVYPEAISYLPLPQLWAVLFFLMCLTICIDSQFTLAETVLTTLQDVWPKFVTKWSIAIKCLYGVLIFLAALPFASRGGMYLFQLMDWYFAAFSVLVNAILECIIIGWIYGKSWAVSRRPTFYVWQKTTIHF
ncbi:sodium- and chloride-dependent glycine transporter 1 [Biomphalaria pfeifferi]|uniref:Sodium- and chloride-dependent glycine transporter 1 n=1 Tax=Biomphalaria pfeifferi TaxID=112525 RepID=A0AAD8F5K1_BIOPF|nr:sodium- and chloride-dependent glycine transporter 1 [Biomphalaria pfeifferi]